MGKILQLIALILISVSLRAQCVDSIKVYGDSCERVDMPMTTFVDIFTKARYYDSVKAEVTRIVKIHDTLTVVHNTIDTIIQLKDGVSVKEVAHLKSVVTSQSEELSITKDKLKRNQIWVRRLFVTTVGLAVIIIIL